VQLALSRPTHSRPGHSRIPTGSSRTNGEINTIRGKPQLDGRRARRLLATDANPGRSGAPDAGVVRPDGSDSMSFDEVLELLHLGRNAACRTPYS